MHFTFSPRQEHLWIELLRDATMAERCSIAARMTQFERDRMREKIATDNPNFTPEERKLKLIEVYYGKELAEEVREYTKDRTWPD